MSLFTLPPLEETAPSLPQLSPSKAQFTLPQLDEHAPGVERLLGSLRDGLLIAAAHEVPFNSPRREAVKGDEGKRVETPGLDGGDTVVPDEEGAKEEEEEEGKPAAEHNIWAQAALAGPSRVEVSYMYLPRELTIAASDMDAVFLGNTVPLRETTVLRPAHHAVRSAAKSSSPPDTRVESTHHVIPAPGAHASRDTRYSHERFAEVEPAGGEIRIRRGKGDRGGEAHFSQVSSFLTLCELT